MKISDSNSLFWAGLAVAIGSFGVVLASIFYALSPVSAALPVPDGSMSTAIQGMISGQTTMVAAGRVGVISDVILIAGSFLMAFYRPSQFPIERLGWVLIALGVIIFIFVDVLSAGVLTQLAALDDVTSFSGFKLLFDILFIFGTLTVGMGAPAILVGELKATVPVLSKPLVWVGILFSLAGFVASTLYFAHVALPQLIGISIAIISLVFGIYGIQTVRQSNSL